MSNTPKPPQNPDRVQRDKSVPLEENNRPLISYFVMSYNQELFIREGIESAFAQTYTPLEIIISDDCSKDRTFEIAQELVESYTGPHSVRLNRNIMTLGIGRHVNRLMELCTGALVVASAGDDISLPNRTEEIFRAWDMSGRRATSVFSSYTIITENGLPDGHGGMHGDSTDPQSIRALTGSLLNFLSHKNPAVNGCTHAWSPKLFSIFGPISTDLEDLVLSFRSLALGELLYIHEPLVKYRRHGSNVSFLAGRDDTRSFTHREKRLLWVDDKHVTAYDNMMGDIQTLRGMGLISAYEITHLQAEAKRRRNFYALERDLLQGSFARNWYILGQTACKGDFILVFRFLPRALPKAMYRALYMIRAKWRNQRE